MKPLLILSLFIATSLSAFSFEPKGRVDVGAAYFHLRFLEDLEAKNVEDFYGGRIDATVLPFSGTGFCLKPYAFGADTLTNPKGAEGYLWGAGIGVGHYTPLCDKLMLVPVVGYSYSEIHSYITFTLPIFFNGRFPKFPGTLEDMKSNSFYVGTEVILKLNKCLTATGIYQYAFAWSRTKLTHPLFSPILNDGRSQGSNMAFVLDYQLTPRFALSGAFGYNLSLDDQRFGIEAFGVKIGIAGCFY